MTTKQKFIEYNPASKDNGYRWIENASRGLRVVGLAHEVAKAAGYPRMINHTGWYLDPLGAGDTVCGAVLHLPSRDGRACYLAAVTDPWSTDCYLVDFSEVFSDEDADEAKREAARRADGMAEAYAEREREYQTLETAKMRIEEARERIAAERLEAHALAAEMRAARALRPKMPAICSALRSSMAAHRAAVRAAVAEIRDLTSNPYSWLEKAWR